MKQTTRKLKTIYISISILALTFVSLILFSSVKVYAQLPSALPMSVNNYLKEFDNKPYPFFPQQCNCYPNGLYTSLCMTAVDMWGNQTGYPADNTTLHTHIGGPPVSIQFNSIGAQCRKYVYSPNPYYSFPADLSNGAYALTSQYPAQFMYYIKSVSVSGGTSNGSFAFNGNRFLKVNTSPPSKTGSSKEYQTRFWYGNLNGFTYTPPNNSWAYQNNKAITLNIDAVAAAWWPSPNNSYPWCISNGTSGAFDKSGIPWWQYCQDKVIPLSFTINVSGFSNIATLKPYRGTAPSGNNMVRNWVYNFMPGMENLGGSGGPWHQSQWWKNYIWMELLTSNSPYKQASSVSDISPFGTNSCPYDPPGPNYGYNGNWCQDQYVSPTWVQGFNNGCTASGNGCVPHYFWGRYADPAYEDPLYYPQYRPVQYKVNSNAKPGDQVCLQNAVTPTAYNNLNPTYSNKLCYHVYVPLTCGVPNIEGNPSPGAPTTITFGISPSVGGGSYPNNTEGMIDFSINGDIYPYPATYNKSSNQWSIYLPKGLPAGNNYISYTFNPSPGSYVGGSNYAATNGNATYGSPVKCGGPLKVATKPYFKVYGGDVIAGVCSQSIPYHYIAGSGINAWNNGGNGDQGSGTTTAALATGNIDGFASGQNILSMLNPPPLTMANTSTGLYGYGGNFTSTSSTCTSTGSGYYSLASQLAKSMSNNPNYHIVNCDNQSQQCQVNIGTLDNGIHYIYLSTNKPVYINSNIYYPNNISSVSDIPSLEVVTKGNIYINPNVTNIAGTFIAEGGTINDIGGSNTLTCNSGSTDPKNPCQGAKKLTIDGSFIANQIDLYRTYGALSAAKNSPTPDNGYAAEEFDYSPLNWLVPGNPNSLNVQSITSLPPVL